MHVILMNEPRCNESIILALGLYLIWIHHKARKHRGPTKCQHAHGNRDAHDGIGDKRVVHGVQVRNMR